MTDCASVQKQASVKGDPRDVTQSRPSKLCQCPRYLTNNQRLSLITGSLYTVLSVSCHLHRTSRMLILILQRYHFG